MCVCGFLKLSSISQVHHRDGERGGACGRHIAHHRDPAGLSGAQQLQWRSGGGERHELIARLQTRPHL